ncbi:MAG: hypothetical protein WBD30_17615 [Bacteroidota bacterium]
MPANYLMPEPQSHIVHVLQSLELPLRERGQREKWQMVSSIAENIRHADDLGSALELLYTVRGFDRFALRLMWYAEQASAVPAESASDRLVGYQLDRLLEDLLSSESSQKGEEAETPMSGVHDLETGVRRFSAAVANVRKDGYKGGEFVGLTRPAVEALVKETEHLHAAASVERNSDVVQFSAAFARFAQFVLEKGLLQDVRVVNFMENASLTLETAVGTTGADDYDSLTQTTELLEKPDTLLDLTTSSGQ